jgi:hypothetical protein
MSRLLGSAVSVAIHGLVAALFLWPADLKVRTTGIERGRWRDFSYTRLRQFGYRFDTY